MLTEMDLTYKKRFTDAKIPEAYEALILDALRGDHSNFVRNDELDVAWKVGILYVLSTYLTEDFFFPDFHTNLTLDRWSRWAPSPSICLWFQRPPGTGQFYRQA